MILTCKFSLSDRFSGKFKLSSFLDMVAKILDQKIKEPNAGVFTDTGGYVFDSSYLDWSRIYFIFYSDYFSFIAHDQCFYMHIQNF